jgi:hypothetical protein
VRGHFPSVNKTRPLAVSRDRVRTLRAGGFFGTRSTSASGRLSTRPTALTGSCAAVARSDIRRRIHPVQAQPRTYGHLRVSFEDAPLGAEALALRAILSGWRSSYCFRQRLGGSFWHRSRSLTLAARFARAVGRQLIEPLDDCAVAAMLLNQPV